MIKFLIKKIKALDVSLGAVLFCIYLIITPIQTLLMLGGSTYSKFLSLSIMVIIVVPTLLKNRSFSIDMDMLKRCLPYLAWCLLSVLWVTNINKFLVGYVSCASYFVFFLIIISYNWTNNEKKLFKKTALYSCLFYSILLIFLARYMTRASIVLGEDGEETNENLLALSIAVGAIISINYYLFSKNYKKSFLYILYTLIIFTAIICTGSRGGFIATLIGIIYLLYSHRNTEGVWVKIKRLFIVFVITLILVLFTGVLGNEYVTGRFTESDSMNLSGRDAIWSSYVRMLISKPYSIIIGYGYSGAVTEHKKFNHVIGFRPTHNDFLALVVETGIIGFILFCFFLISVWNRSKYIYGDYLGRACYLVVIIGALDMDFFNKYAFWNSVIFACIGIGVNAFVKKNEDN